MLQCPSIRVRHISLHRKLLYTRVKLHLATSSGFEVLPTNGNCLKSSGLLLQHSHATGTAVPNAVLAAAPRFSAHLTLQQMDTRDALAYASSSA